MKTFTRFVLVALLPLFSPPLLTGQPFRPVDAVALPTTLTVPQTNRHHVLLHEGEGGAPGDHTMIGYVPIDGSSVHGYLAVGHDSSGVTFTEVKREAGAWSAAGRRALVDFKATGGIWRARGGAVTPAGTVLVGETEPPASNTELPGAKRDTSPVEIEFGGKPRTLDRFRSIGWMVEVDPANGRAARRLYAMGRFSHGGAVCMPDRRTVFLTDAHDPSVLFKFIATKADDYGTGQLFAYRQSADGSIGLWVPMPMELDSLANIRDVAIRRGATLFIRLAGIALSGDKLYIAETGKDLFDWTAARAMRGVPAAHLRDARRTGPGAFRDAFGRILELSPITGRMRVLLEGGPGTFDRRTFFSNPDGMGSLTVGDKRYLVVTENTIDPSGGRVSQEAEAAKLRVSEIYVLDPTEEKLSIESLKRFLVAPAGADPAGLAFTPDGSTLFTSIREPSEKNPAPFDRSTTIAVSIEGEKAEAKRD